MNALFLTQSVSLRVFYELAQALGDETPVGRTGFYVSNSAYFREFVADTPDIESGSYVLVKEWELLERAAGKKPDIEKLRGLERKLSAPNLWGPIVADRRLIWGQMFNLRLDYRPQFTHEEILSITEEVITSVENLFDIVDPDVVVSFICTTIGGYAAYLVAKSRNIPFLNLRPTRIENYMTYGTSVFEPSELVRSEYEAYGVESSEDDEWIREARTFLAEARSQSTRYEGTLPVSRKAPTEANRIQRTSRRSPTHIVRATSRLLKEERNLRHKTPKGDHHLPGVLLPLLYRRLLNPALARRVDAQLRDEYLQEADLGGLDYAFLPLHTEPEVTLLVYSRAFTNQIEVARNLAYNLPSGMKLVVKDHPAALGKRKVSYYRKLLDIPNVRLADPALEARTVLESARLVTTIAGSVGLEALFHRKPVITLGQTPYELLPSTMVKRVDNLDRLGEAIADLLRDHNHDEQALTYYVAAVMRRSVALNFYTSLLGRGGYSNPEAQRARETEIKELADFTLASLRLVRGSTRDSRTHASAATPVER